MFDPPKLQQKCKVKGKKSFSQNGCGGFADEMKMLSQKQATIRFDAEQKGKKVQWFKKLL